jgi:hypothetical protein
VDEVVVELELVVGVVVELLDDDVPLNWATVIVTVLPFFAVVPPLGDWEITFPSWLWLVTVLVLRCTLKPAAWRALVAPAAGSPTTGGTVAVVGAAAITIVTVEPGAALEPPLGLWLITFPGVTVSEVCVCVTTLNPAEVRAVVALLWLWPTTLGTDCDGGPEDMNRVTPLPSGTFVPARGSVPVA